MPGACRSGSQADPEAGQSLMTEYRMPTHVCPKCGGRFEQGFTLDQAHNNQSRQAAWIEGKPERSFWTGLATKGRVQHMIVTYRCGRCGFLESYAGAE